MRKMNQIRIGMKEDF